MSETHETDMRTPGHMSESPYFTEQPTVTAVQGPSQGPVLNTGLTATLDTTPGPSGVVNLQAGPWPKRKPVHDLLAQTAPVETLQPWVALTGAARIEAVQNAAALIGADPPLAAVPGPLPGQPGNAQSTLAPAVAPYVDATQAAPTTPFSPHAPQTDLGSTPMAQAGLVNPYVERWEPPVSPMSAPVSAPVFGADAEQPPAAALDPVTKLSNIVKAKRAAMEAEMNAGLAPVAMLAPDTPPVATPVAKMTPLITPVPAMAPVPETPHTAPKEDAASASSAVGSASEKSVLFGSTGLSSVVAFSPATASPAAPPAASPTVEAAPSAPTLSFISGAVSEPETPATSTPPAFIDAGEHRELALSSSEMPPAAAHRVQEQVSEQVSGLASELTAPLTADQAAELAPHQPVPAAQTWDQGEAQAAVQAQPVQVQPIQAQPVQAQPIQAQPVQAPVPYEPQSVPQDMAQPPVGEEVQPSARDMAPPPVQDTAQPLDSTQAQGHPAAQDIPAEHAPHMAPVADQAVRQATATESPADQDIVQGTDEAVKPATPRAMDQSTEQAATPATVRVALQATMQSVAHAVRGLFRSAAPASPASDAPVHPSERTGMAGSGGEAQKNAHADAPTGTKSTVEQAAELAAEQASEQAPEQSGQPQRSLSLFDPVEILRGGMLPEDLPFANEVDAALARRPLRMERYLSLAVGCGILLFILWSAFASIDEVTHAEGQVISSQRTQAIQNLEGGILRNILVSEGQTVEKGDVLAQLDNEMAASSYRDAINKALDNTLAIIRLEAERKGEVPQFPENVEEWVQEVVGPQNMMTALPQAHQAIKDQMSAYQARTQQKTAELQLLESQYQQRMHEVGELSARKRQLDESLALAVEQRDIAAGLLQKRSTSRVDYLNQQQRVVQLSGEVEALASTIPKAQSAAQETSQRMTFRRAEIDAAVTDELNKRRMDLASINETLSAGGDRVTRTELRSPVRGTVKRIAVTTLGGVVKPGESIMEIVPLDDTLLVEAKVRPSDVAFLRPGQRAMVKVSAYDFSIYGGLEGALEQISADTIEDKRGEFFYLVKVRTNKTAIQHQDKSLPIIPGMMATVDILIGKKTVLDYLLKPILKARDRALRER